MIDTFSLPATRLAFPAITVCKGRPYDVGEYLRAVFDSFEWVCEAPEGGKNCGPGDNSSTLLRDHYHAFRKSDTYSVRTASYTHVHGYTVLFTCSL